MDLSGIMGYDKSKGSKHLKILSGIVISGLGALTLGKIFNTLPFAFNVADSDLLLATSVGSLVGGLYLLFTSFERESSYLD